jgi:hypothetical protein
MIKASEDTNSSKKMKIVIVKRYGLYDTESTKLGNLATIPKALFINR